MGESLKPEALRHRLSSRRTSQPTELPTSEQDAGPPSTPVVSTLFKELLAACIPPDDTAAENASAPQMAAATMQEAGRKTYRFFTQEAEQQVGIVSMLQQILARKMEPSVQEARGSAHIDVALSQAINQRPRYMLRLQQRSDFPELYDGLLFF